MDEEKDEVAQLPQNTYGEGKGLVRTRQQQFTDLTGTDLADKDMGDPNDPKENNLENFNEMESCRISGMTSSFKSNNEVK